MNKESKYIKISAKSENYLIPEYNLTGDILSFLTCNLQYRYQNKGSLPPSRPIQLWFGEFIHGVMEEAFNEWQIDKTPFPWDWEKKIRPIEVKIAKRMENRGLYPPYERYFSPTRIVDENGDLVENTSPQKKIVSTRVEHSINILGKELFPLIDSSEVLITGLREMPQLKENVSRADYYCINGVIDVLSSLKINEELENNNLIVKYLKNTGKFEDTFKNSKNENQDGNPDEKEIIIDYKGMIRPNIKSLRWEEHFSQVLTYSWLRSRLNDSKEVIAGIIFYLNELVPSAEDLRTIKEDIKNKQSDIKLSKSDKEKLLNWDGKEDSFPQLSDEFKIDRSIRIIKIDKEAIKNSLNEFDQVVANIECCIIKESRGKPIKEAWKGIPDKRTCDACDFKNFCNQYKPEKNKFTIP